MILSRLSRALRQQNWVAVALEFIIVIVGVVIGFQITAWNADRARLERAEVLTERLIADLRDEQWRIEGTARYYEQVADNAQRALDTLEGRRDVDDETLVLEAFRATQIFNFPVIRTTYNELIATGAVDLIEDEDLITLAVEYYETPREELNFMDPGRPYRYAFYRLADRALYEDLADHCAEPRLLQIGDYAALPQILEFPCDINGHDAAIAATAARLRADDEIIPLLRQRAIEASMNSRQDYWQNAFGHALPEASP